MYTLVILLGTILNNTKVLFRPLSLPKYFYIIIGTL